MAGWIDSFIRGSSSNLSIECRTFHSWAWHKLGYNYNAPSSAFLEKANAATLRYDAILIDEGQDFDDKWFMGLTKLLNQQTNSLFIAYDNTQSVYGNPHRRRSDWSWAKLGIDIRGRADVLEMNYRNSPEIGLAAWIFFLKYINRSKVPVSRTSAGAIVQPKFKTSRSSGIAPLLFQFTNFDDIATQIAEAFRNNPESSIAIMMHPDLKDIIQTEISLRLHNRWIDHHAPRKSQDRNGNVVKRPCLVIDSWNALKGVEFDAVILIDIDYVESFYGCDDEFEQYSGLYTAMTRARDHLILVYKNKKAVIGEIKSAIDQAAAVVSRSSQ